MTVRSLDSKVDLQKAIRMIRLGQRLNLIKRTFASQAPTRTLSQPRRMWSADLHGIVLISFREARRPTVGSPSSNGLVSIAEKDFLLNGRSLPIISNSDGFRPFNFFQTLKNFQTRPLPNCLIKFNLSGWLEVVRGSNEVTEADLESNFCY